MKSRMNPLRAKEVFNGVRKIIFDYYNEVETKKKDLKYTQKEVDEAFQIMKKGLRSDIPEAHKEIFNLYPKIYKRMYLWITKRIIIK
jgi:hypothetical protein